MRITYPKAIQESEEELMSLEQRLRGQKTADRVRMLRLLKSGAVKSLKDCAPLVGYSGIQLTRWWERYRAEGLTGMLKLPKPVGKASRLTPEAWAGLLQAMRAGHIATMQMRAIIWSASGPSATRTASRCGGSSRNSGSSGRPGADDTRKPMPSNKPPLKNFGSLIKQPPLKRLVALDEGRFGLITWLRRRWCPLGERPPWIVHDEYEWLWLYAAVEPTTGVFLFLPTVEGQCLEIFLRHLRHELAEGPIGVILDSSGSHRSGEVVWPQDMHPLYLPPYSPELNPAEQIFRHLRKNLSNTIFTTLDELQNALTARRKQHTSAFVQQCNLREGVEATISQGVRTFGMRRSRYIGEAKTHLQHVGIAAAINVCRLINWLDGIGPAPTRVSAFQRLFFAA